MKAKSFLLAGVALLVATHVSAQSAEEQVRQRVLSFYQTLNDGNAAAWVEHNASAASYHGNFPREGALLGTNTPVASNMQQGFDSGATSYNLTVHHIDVSVYGGDAAVATFYTTGPSVIAVGTASSCYLLRSGSVPPSASG